MNILIFAMEKDRWAPARLPKYLVAAGFRVAALCPPTNVLVEPRHLEAVFDLHDLHAARRMGWQLVTAMKTFNAQFVIPADESSVAVLHALIRQAPHFADIIPPEQLQILTSSLGHPDRLEGMLYKSVTQQLARKIGVLAPPGGTVASEVEAVELAGRIGFPLYVKQSFSWAGWGVARCETQAEMLMALEEAMARKPGLVKSLVKRMVDRAWFRSDKGIDLQKGIDGAPAMYCVAAVDGHVAGGFAGFPLRTAGTNGPSTINELGDHPQMAESAARMTQALRATGLIGFDFMIEKDSGNAYLLECNPRPIQTQHLGGLVGVDLCAALKRGLDARAAGQTPHFARPTRSARVALFPQEWAWDPASDALRVIHHDVPWDDPKLLAAMIELTRPRAEEKLREAERRHASKAPAPPEAAAAAEKATPAVAARKDRGLTEARLIMTQAA